MKHTYLGTDPAMIERVYQQYLQDHDSVDESWQKFFEGFDFARTAFGEQEGIIPEQLQKEFRVLNLINGYRTRGHLFTRTNPVRERRKYTPTLELQNFGLNETDLDTVFQAGTEIGAGPATLRSIIARLEKTYCTSIGAEYKYIRTPEIIQWLEKKMEGSLNTPAYSVEQKRHILNKLNQAVAFENFIHTRFTGQKRFSLEGCEALIPALDAVIHHGAELGIKEYVIGMAHRGRLNVLANILGKKYEEIFTEFEGIEYEDNLFAGDVKYHLGFSSNISTRSGKNVHLSVTPNPSHLEAVDAVVQGMVRAKMDQTVGGTEDMIAPILIHGDAAVAGQGIVYEVIQMSQLRGYRTGGTIHLVLNNQIGFTTNYLDARSSTYCTDVAKVTLSPVFHVNADDVEALVFTIQLAMEFRQQFHRDVFIDILGYRKYGHNEGDEPRFTQPLLYKAIASHPNAREVYVQKLIEQGEVEAEMARAMDKEFRQLLNQSFETARKSRKQKESPSLEGSWKGLRKSTPADFLQSPDTSVPEEVLRRCGIKFNSLPAGKNFFNKTRRLFEERRKMIEENRPIDWAMGEWLAYATLLLENNPVRISGQDVERGTFSHRHAVVTVEDSEERYIPLQHLNDRQGSFSIYNSLLSEYGVLGFEYGYALSSPHSLVIWEAQFGDFSNGAQIIIDQYISSAEDKWNRQNGIVLLLPHGYEGQGAEHSSARIERFLALCAEENMLVVNCSTPANFFHVLRRQLKWPFRKPLIVFTPKSLLRHPECVSPLSDFSNGRFQEVIGPSDERLKDAQRLLMCSGKVYYDLLHKIKERNDKHTAILRLEQLYPFPEKQLNDILKKYAGKIPVRWVQEEPANMGANWYMQMQLKHIQGIDYVCRASSASPASGSYKVHEKEQSELLTEALK
jgi:2-oxoglutarate dehydrogenase E1 component